MDRHAASTYRYVAKPIRLSATGTQAAALVGLRRATRPR